MIDSSPLPPVPEFSARQVVGADVLPGLRWMLAPAAVAGHRLASALRLLLRLLRPLHERLGAVPEVRLPPRRPGPACSGVVRGRSTGAGHVRPRDAWAFNMAAYKSPLSQTSTSGNRLNESYPSHQWAPFDSHGKVDQNPGSRYCHIHNLHPRGRE